MALLGEPPPTAAWHRPTVGAHGAPAPLRYTPKQHPKFLSPEKQVPGKGPRPGGRTPEEMRPCRMRTSAVPNAAGSGYVELGRTKVLVAVYGPRQADARSVAAEGVLNVDVTFTAFCGRACADRDDRRIVLYSTLLQSTLESIVLLDRYPKTQIDLHVLIIEDHGSALSTALTAASLALADAAIEVTDLAAGATVHYARNAVEIEGQVLLDCDGDEETRLPDASAVLHLGFCPSRGRVCLLHSSGPMVPTTLERMVILAKETTEAIRTEMQRCLVRRVERRATKRKRVEALAVELNEEMTVDDGIGAEETG